MNRPIHMLLATVVLGAGLGATAAAYAAPEAKLNKCWGQVTKQFAPLGDHASAHSPVTPDPGEGGRTGVGNVSKSGDFGFIQLDPMALGDGAQGRHAMVVAPSSTEFQASLPEECQGTEMLP